MTDPNSLSDSDLNLTTQEQEIIRCFVRGQKRSLVGQNLKLEYTETSIRLSAESGNISENRTPKLLGISKQVNQWQRKILIANNSVYRSIIVDALTEMGFITKDKSSHPDFTEYHYYTFPEGYKLNYTEVIQLWRVWWNHKRYQLNMTGSPIDARIFSKGNWYALQDLQPKQGNFLLQTTKGIITLDPEEYLVWIERVESEDADLAPTTTPTSRSTLPADVERATRTAGQAASFGSHPLERRAPSDRSVATATQSGGIDEEIDLEAYLNTFNTEDTEDVDRIEGIYQIDELLEGSGAELENDDRENVLPAPEHPPVQTSLTTDVTQTPAAAQVAPEPSSDLPAPAAVVAEPTAQPATEPTPNPKTPTPTIASAPPAPPSLAQRQESLKHKALAVLAKYVREGDRIVRTEVLKNGQGQEINRKIVKTQRGCPQWAIEQILKLS